MVISKGGIKNFCVDSRKIIICPFHYNDFHTFKRWFIEIKPARNQLKITSDILDTSIPYSYICKSNGNVSVNVKSYLLRNVVLRNINIEIILRLSYQYQLPKHPLLILFPVNIEVTQFGHCNKSKPTSSLACVYIQRKCTNKFIDINFMFAQAHNM